MKHSLLRHVAIASATLVTLTAFADQGGKKAKVDESSSARRKTRKPVKTRTTYETLDLWEARESKGLEADLPGATWEAKVDGLIMRLARVDRLGAEALLRNWKNFKSDFHEMPTAKNELIPDVNYAAGIPENCQTFQAIKQNGNPQPLEKRYLAVAKLWQKLDLNHKAALVAHELMVKKEMDQADFAYTDAIRYFTGIWASTEFERLTPAQYVAIYQAKIKDSQLKSTRASVRVDGTELKVLGLRVFEDRYFRGYVTPEMVDEFNQNGKLVPTFHRTRSMNRFDTHYDPSKPPLAELSELAPTRMGKHEGGVQFTTFKNTQYGPGVHFRLAAYGDAQFQCQSMAEIFRINSEYEMRNVTTDSTQSVLQCEDESIFMTVVGRGPSNYFYLMPWLRMELPGDTPEFSALRKQMNSANAKASLNAHGTGRFENYFYVELKSHLGMPHQTQEFLITWGDFEVTQTPAGLAVKTLRKKGTCDAQANGYGNVYYPRRCTSY